MRDAGASQITGNAEINSIKQILGLQHGKVSCGTVDAALYRRLEHIPTYSSGLAFL